MTIIRPISKYNSFYIAFILLILLATAGLYIYQYNAEVALRHRIQSLEDNIVGFETENSALKNKLYGLLDPKNLESLASKRGLVFENSPIYLNLYPDFKDLTRR